MQCALNIYLSIPLGRCGVCGLGALFCILSDELIKMASRSRLARF